LGKVVRGVGNVESFCAAKKRAGLKAVPTGKGRRFEGMDRNGLMVVFSMRGGHLLV
jgi:hypothetical protein